MKLYLSSYRIPNQRAFFELFDNPEGELRGVIIINAKDTKPEGDRRQKIASLQEYLGSLGLGDTTLIDLRAYDDTSELEASLRNYDYIYAMGGNSFDLRSAMAQSGFDKTARELLDDGPVYVGESAGAILAGPSLRGFESMDSAEGRDEVSRDGLSLIDAVIVPHSDSTDPRYQNRVPLIQAANPNLEILPLNDNVAYVINGDRVTVVTAT